MSTIFMQPVFQAPVNLKSIPDNEFWEQMKKLDELSEQFSDTPNGFSVSMNADQQKVHIPFVKFSKNISSIKS